MNEVALAGRLLAACCAVGCVLAAFRYVALALRRSRRTDARSIAVLETAYLPGGASLHVVRVGDRRLVIGRSASHIAMLAALEV